MSNRLSRRGFIALLTGFVAAAGVSCSRLLNGLLQGEVTEAPTQTPPSLHVTSEPDPTKISNELLPTKEVDRVGGEHPEATLPPQEKADFGSRVTYVHAEEATHWDFGDTYYGDSVRQDVIDEMVNAGILGLTNAKNIDDAWRQIIPQYTPGKTGIAIKVNFNNNFWCDRCRTDCGEWENQIDGLIHPINSVIQGLKKAYSSFEVSDIWIFDATIGDNPPVSHRHIPRRFIDGCRYKDVRFFDRGCNELAGFDSIDESSWIQWSHSSNTPPPQKLTDVLIEAQYIINVPIMKRHIAAGVSLGFKNHYGSIDRCYELHPWTFSHGERYSIASNPLVDIYLNPNIFQKTVLTIGDGLFGDRRSNFQLPEPWYTFGGASPNSLFFSTDPVAIDCVMADFLHAEGFEGGVQAWSDHYLKIASEAGLGTYERGDPFRASYRQIDYDPQYL